MRFIQTLTKLQLIGLSLALVLWIGSFCVYYFGGSESFGIGVCVSGCLIYTISVMLHE